MSSHDGYWLGGADLERGETASALGLAISLTELIGLHV